MRRDFIKICTHSQVTALSVLMLVYSAAPSWGEVSHSVRPKQDAAAASKLAPKAKIGVHDAETTDLLNKFYDRLADVTDAQSADMLESAIEMMWHRSGSATVDLLMSRSLSARVSSRLPMNRKDTAL